MHRLYRILLNQAPVEGGGNPPPTPTPAPAPSTDKGADLTKALEGLLAKHGDPNAALRVLLSENYEAREKNRELKAKVPAADALVLDAEKAKLFASYQALGSPEDIKGGLTERDEYKTKVTAHERAAEIATVAKLAEFDPEVLTTLAGDLQFSVEDAKDKAGKPIKVPHVKDGDKTVPLADYAKSRWEKFLPSLKPTATKAPAGGSPPVNGYQSPRPTITPAEGAVRRRNSL